MTTGSHYGDGYLAGITAVRQALDQLQTDVQADAIDALEFDPDPTTQPPAPMFAAWLVPADADDPALLQEVTDVATWLINLAKTRPAADVLAATTAISDDRRIGELLAMLVLVNAR